jgi:RNA polymerase sigma-70 factor (ECF subfamily)
MGTLRLIKGGASEGGGGAGQEPPSAGGPAGPRHGQTGELLKALYDAHAPAVFARCRYLLRDEEAARDALQDVFVKVLRALPEFRSQASPHTWVLKIATHHCLNLQRAERAQWREQVKQLAVGRAHETEPPERRELLRALLGSAGPEEQEVAVLTFVDEMTQAEIAAITGRSLPTVRKRLRDFLAAARAALREAWPGLELAESEVEGGAP